LGAQRLNQGLDGLLSATNFQSYIEPIDLPWIDQYSGKQFEITTEGCHRCRGVARVITYGKVLREYELGRLVIGLIVQNSFQFIRVGVVKFDRFNKLRWEWQWGSLFQWRFRVRRGKALVDCG
jgi:hypothetical protein